ncbi:MAG: PQQ-binding-like beta-propeller repeat protein [bacterium]
MKRCLILIGALMLWGGALGWAATPPWPQYQHDGQHTGRSQYPGPDNSKLKWKKQLGAGGCYVTIGTGNRIYIGNDKLYALTPYGANRWSYYSGGNLYTPIIDSNGRIYGATTDGWLFCVRDEETKGTVVWKKKLGEKLFAPAISLDERKKGRQFT